MDNGLIFPYRRTNEPAEASNAELGSLMEVFGSKSDDPATQTCIRQAAE